MARKTKKSFTPVKVISASAAAVTLSGCFFLFSTSNPPSICGNAIPNDGFFGNEGCDDGNLVSGDGCSSDCQIEAGFECTDPFDFETSVCVPAACGNGLSAVGQFETNPDEACDDGNVINGDGCSDLCQIEANFICSGTPSDCIPTVETCDNGVEDDNDGLIDCQDPDCTKNVACP